VWDDYKEDCFMRKTVVCFAPISLFLLSLTGCNAIGDKSGSLSMIYGITALLSLLLLIGYCCIGEKRIPWFVLLFSSVGSIVRATLRDKVESIAYAAILAAAVFVNIGVWLIEQLVRIDFEILSVSYIISECFLLGLHLFIAENNRKKLQEPQSTSQEASLPQPASTLNPADQAQLELFAAGLPRLTAKEQMLYDCYIAGMSTVQIMEKLNIKENTLKFHNKNLYSKLGVSSRKQLLHFASLNKHLDYKN